MQCPGGRGGADVRQRIDDPPVRGGVHAGAVEQSGETTVPATDDRPAQGPDGVGVVLGEIGRHESGERGRGPGVECGGLPLPGSAPTQRREQAGDGEDVRPVGRHGGADGVEPGQQFFFCPYPFAGLLLKPVEDRGCVEGGVVECVPGLREGEPERAQRFDIEQTTQVGGGVVTVPRAGASGRGEQADAVVVAQHAHTDTGAVRDIPDAHGAEPTDRCRWPRSPKSPQCSRRRRTREPGRRAGAGSPCRGYGRGSCRG